MRAASSVTPAACLWPPKRRNTSAQRLEAREQIERGDAAARSVRDAVLDRQHERRLVVRLDELRRDDADDAAVPVVAGDDEHVLRRRSTDPCRSMRLRVGDDRGFLLLAPGVLLRQLSRQIARAVRVISSSRPRISSRSTAQVRRAHPAGGVEPRREHEADVKAVERRGRAGRSPRAALRCPAPCAARSTGRRGRSGRSRGSRRRSGTTSASVPIAATLTKCGSSSAPRPLCGEQRLHQLERDADAGQHLVRIRAVAPLRVDDGQRRRQRRLPARGGR